MAPTGTDESRWSWKGADGGTIRSIMRDLGLQAAQPRAKARSTMPAEDLDDRPDLLKRDSRR